MNPDSRSGESAQGESRLADELCKVISKAQSLYIKQRFSKGVQRNITDLFKAWITTDNIKIFSVTFCTLVTVYCFWKNIERRFQNCDIDLRYNFLVAALRCSSFRFKTVICLRLYLLCSWDVQCCILERHCLCNCELINLNAVWRRV